MLCSYGCGRVAVYETNSKKPVWICSKSANSCPSLNKKQRDKAVKTMQMQRKMAFDSGDLIGKGKGTIKRTLRECVGSVCIECNITEWKGKSIVLELHHIDGDSKNNKVNNLQLLCPNCHSQTLNYCNKWRRDD
jgi:5-methylcytosine-specific restriction endonuclease McrA